MLSEVGGCRGVRTADVEMEVEVEMEIAREMQGRMRVDGA
jgi:hypothetical protein